MKKIIIVSLVALTIVSLSGSAIAGINWEWMMDINAEVQDSNIEIRAKHNDQNIHYGTEAMIIGNGMIDIQGKGIPDQGMLTTTAIGEGTKIYASSGLGVVGCLSDCQEKCEECPDYFYWGSSLVKIKHGKGIILISETANTKDGINDQRLKAAGSGDFTAYMNTDLWINDEEPLSHTMGAYGQNVDFQTCGIISMNPNNGENTGEFITNMNFHDDGCVEDNCFQCEQVELI